MRLPRWIEDLRNLPHDAGLAYRRGGLSDLCRTLGHRSVYRVCCHGHLVIIAQTLDSFREVPAPPGTAISTITRSDWPALEAFVTRRDLEVFSRRLDHGMVGLVAWRARKAVGYTWMAPRLYPFLTPVPIPLPPDAAYLFDLYVPPAERSGGIGSALVSARLSLARNRGFREGWRMVSRDNAPSLRTVNKTAGSGTYLVGELSYVKVLGRVFSRYRVPSQPELG